jgi:hypothetical protein
VIQNYHFMSFTKMKPIFASFQKVFEVEIASKIFIDI